MDLGLVEARDERREELAQYRGPFGVLGAARGVPHIAVELEIARLDAGFLQRLDDGGRDLRREQRVAAS